MGSPQDLQAQYPALQIVEADPAVTFDLITSHLQDRGVAFIPKLLSPELIGRARQVAMLHLAQTGVISDSRGTCTGRGVLLTGYKPVTHHPDMK
jgi:hypothetical protein